MLTADPAIANVLKTVPLFADMGDESRGDLAAACTLVEIAAGEAVFREKEAAQEVYFVVSGQVRMTCSTIAGPDVVVGYVEVVASWVRWESSIQHRAVHPRLRPRTRSCFAFPVKHSAPSLRRGILWRWCYSG